MKDFHKERFDQATFDEKKLALMHLMRVTVHVVPSDDLPMYFQATRDAVKKFYRSRKLSWPPTLTKTHKAVLDIIRDKGKATTTEVREKLDYKHPRLGTLIRYDLASMGLIIRARLADELVGGLKQWEWVLTKSWLPEIDLESISAKEAKKWLIKKYLKAFGPSSIYDIVSWTWHTITETRSLIKELYTQKEVSKVAVAGKDEPQWMSSDDLEELERFQSELEEDRNVAKPFVRILPEFDPFVVGYRKRWKDRIKIPHQLLYEMGIIRHPAPSVILLNGQIVGKVSGKPRFEWVVFDKIPKDYSIGEAILNEMERCARFRGATSMEIRSVNAKPLTSKTLKPLLKYFYEAGFMIRRDRLYKELL